MKTPRISIVVPVVNEEAGIVAFLQALQTYRQRGHEVIVVDGGSRDATVALCEGLVDYLLNSAPGRARQMNAGAALASREVLWFVHADTQLPDSAEADIQRGLRDHHWGRFNVRLSARGAIFSLIARLMNVRSCLTAIATGDQAIFVRRDTFVQLGGYADIPLMEDVELSRRLKRLSRPACIATPVITSARRWQHHGIWRTVLLMWRLRLAYFFGADPARLARQYK